MIRTPAPSMWLDQDALAAACARAGHPGATFNPFPSVNRTWCACGNVTYEGDQAVHGIACCGGPLESKRFIREGDPNDMLAVLT